MRLSRPHAFFAALFLGASFTAAAQTNSDVALTKHNLSVDGPGTVVSTNQNQVCVFCHTPHGATLSPGAPLWNRDLSVQTYTTYTSSSLDAVTIAGQLQQPAGASKLCLSCHDGSMAIGMVNVAGGEVDVNIPMSGVGAGGEMPAGEGLQTGYTRNLGTDLTNDHPISLTFDATLVAADGELRDPATTPEVGLRSPGVKPQFPLEATGPPGAAQLQCVSCHDPHLADGADGSPNKFLRGNRLQQLEPAGGDFDADADNVCLACHDKEGWVGSVHASSVTADETYLPADAALREFPADTAVWQAACMNCHDTHSVHGSRRLLREGTDSVATPKAGGNPATEETCYQCHGNAPIVTNVAGDVKNIEADFQLLRRMPITGVDQQATPEAHDIVDADGTEPRVNLGRTDTFNRHAECTDCHNPHRAMKNALFNGTGAPTSAHAHASGHTNLASGALSGTWGVEPTYSGTDFLTLPTGYEVKQGVGTASDVTAPHVTREYQVCLKCHSDYGYDDNNVYPIGTRPDLGSSGGGTPPGTNNMEQYTNQAMEFQAPLGDQGAPGANHRSWHPVMAPTGRTLGLRNMGTGAFLAPWTNDVGTQTMYCSDCHGTNTAQNSVVPTGDRPWGPHGSENDFILKGPWNTGTGGTPNAVDTLCFRCHDAGDYSGTGRGAGTSGFSDGQDNLHTLHSERLERIRCNWCHVAVPHGWKNKALLVNLNDVGEEAGLLPGGTEVPINSAGQTYNIGPYYMNAKLKIRSFATSGNWQEANCGSANNQQGPDDSVGRDWMRAVCEVPP
jgi:hypothetical protein